MEIMEMGRLDLWKSLNGHIHSIAVRTLAVYI